MNDFKFDYFLKVFPSVLRYLHLTIEIAVCALLLGLILGLVLAIIKQYKIKILYPISVVYVDFFRSTPFIVQLFLFYYGFAQFSSVVRNMTPEVALVLTLGMNVSAYIAEIIRGAINSVPSGQYEACLSVGMTNIQAMIRIIMPQAIRVAVPSLSNTFIDLIKGTAVGFTIGVMEMMSKAHLECASSYRYFEVYIAIAIIYWGVNLFFGYFQKKLERHLNKGYKNI